MSKAKPNTANDRTQAPADLRLTKSEQRKVEELARPRVAIVHETIRSDGERELRRPPIALAWSGLAAGLAMGFTLLTTGFLAASLPNAPWAHLIVSLGYPVGFVVVIMGRQQLFTENTLSPVLVVLYHRDIRTLLGMLRLWAIVLVSNLVGAAVFAWVLAHSGAVDQTVQAAFRDLSMTTISGGFGELVMRGIYAGWLIALVLWLLPAAESAQLAIIFLLTYLVGMFGLPHSIAGSVDALYLVSTGVLPLGAFFASFLLPVLIGNVVGGVGLVAALAHAQVIPEDTNA